jgi:hypothetical protein
VSPLDQIQTIGPNVSWFWPVDKHPVVRSGDLESSPCAKNGPGPNRVNAFVDIHEGVLTARLGHGSGVWTRGIGVAPGP